MGMGTDNRPRAMSSGYHIFRQRGIPGACSQVRVTGTLASIVLGCTVGSTCQL